MHELALAQEIVAMVGRYVPAAQAARVRSVHVRIGELAVLPAVRAAAPGTVIVAAGTSCRTQIADGTGRGAEHPAEVLRRALRR